MNSRVLLVAVREVRQRGRSKVFLWSTAVMAVAVAALAALPTILAGDDDGDGGAGGSASARTVGVVGELDEVERSALEFAAGGAVAVESFAERGALATAVEDGDVDAGLVDGEILAAGSGFFGGPQFPREAADALGRAQALASEGLDAEQVAGVLSAPGLAVETVGAQMDPEEQAARLLVANLGITFIYATLILYGTWIVNGVIEEKSSRVVEVLLGAVKPRTLLVGKVAGLGALGVAQLVAITAPALVVAVSLNPEVVPRGVAGGIGALVLWWLLGYAFYSVSMGALGSLASRPEDAQGVQTPAMLLIVAAFFVSFTALQSPESPVAVVASFAPPTAPMAMFVRMLVGDVAAWEVLVAIGLTIAAIWLVALLGARIYEGAVLKTGGRLKVREAWAGADE